MKYNKITTLIAVVALCFIVGCGDDDNGNNATTNANNGNGDNGDNGDENWVTLEVSGEISGEHEGTGSLRTRAQTDNLDFSFTDSEAGEDNSFYISFSDGRDESGIPEPGDYVISTPGADFDGDYGAQYIDHESADSFEDYDNYDSLSGMLTITESSEDSISGTFEFEAALVDDAFQLDESQTISVTNGEFTVPVEL